MRRLRRVFDLKAAKYGLTLSRVRVLRFLEQNSGVSQLELAGHLQIEAPTVKRQIDALVAAGLIHRGPVKDSGRGKGLYLTQKAQSQGYAEFSRDARKKILAGVSEADLAIFHQVLLQMSQNIEELERE